MRSINFSDNLIKAFLIACLLFIIFSFNSQTLNALSMNNANNQIIIEELRLKVPLEYKEIWLKAESEVWQPWLLKQEGFLGRQIFYDKKKGEALLLVNWKNKKLWKSIPTEEVNKMQKIFEENVKKELDIEENPFVFIYEGELLKQQ